MKPAHADSLNGSQRIGVIDNHVERELILKENWLRKSAYRNAVINTGESFFNDTDMRSEYYLVIVYHKKSGTPLLSARYYFQNDLVSKALSVDNQKLVSEDLLHINDLTVLKNRKIFLADRLSGNISSKLYRRNRKFIHFLFYAELKARNKQHNYLIMARKEPGEKLRSNYTDWGLKVVNLVEHNGKPHWVLLGNFTNETPVLRERILLNGLVNYRRLFS